jgi:hypothetical protein
MPTGTLVIVIGSWILLLLLTVGYMVVTRGRDEGDGEGERGSAEGES